MLVLEIVAGLIVLSYILIRLRFASDRRFFVQNFAYIAAASWLAENTCIHLYGFYFYDERWHAFIDQVPLAIILIWPVVIISLWDILRYLRVSEKRLPVFLGMAVFADAFFVESVAVHAGLWRWTQSGPFAVPVIGILGWAFFAAAAAKFILQRQQEDVTRVFGQIFLVALATHAALLVSWWACFRWLPILANTPLWIALAWLGSVPLSIFFYKQNYAESLPFWCLGCRIPAVFFFVGLCVVYPPDLKLVVFIAAFVPPYMLLTPWNRVFLGEKTP